MLLIFQSHKSWHLSAFLETAYPVFSATHLKHFLDLYFSLFHKSSCYLGRTWNLEQLKPVFPSHNHFRVNHHLSLWSERCLSESTPGSVCSLSTALGGQDNDLRRGRVPKGQNTGHRMAGHHLSTSLLHPKHGNTTWPRANPKGPRPSSTLYLKRATPRL